MDTIDDYDDFDEIRKADGKGRISGFQPGAHYYAVQGEGVVRLTRVVRESGIQQPAHELGLAYLDSFGIDRNSVCADDHDATGYWSFKRDSQGNKMVGGNGMLRVWHEWPVGFDYKEFARLSNTARK